MYCGCGDEKKNRAKLIYSKAISLPGRAPATTVTVILNTDTQVSLVKMGDFRLPVFSIAGRGHTHHKPSLDLGVQTQTFILVQLVLYPRGHLSSPSCLFKKPRPGGERG